MKFLLVFLATLACSSVLASDPGQPLDCSDWVFVEPGLSCEMVVAYPCEPNPWVCLEGNDRAVDNQGRILRIRRRTNVGTCGTGGSLARTELVALSNGQEAVVAYLGDRCVPPSTPPGPIIEFWQPGTPNVSAPDENGQLLFDDVGGRVIVPMFVRCDSAGVGGTCPYSSGYQLLAIRGFPTKLDIFQSYIPQAAALGFRVPYMPEGMAGADHFDTYWGTLTHPLDFSQAHSLQCNYPAAAPHVGDYLTVPDTVPTPAPGQGVYYVTAATYQGATRYGRKTTGGHLSGRNPGLLPACVP